MRRKLSILTTALTLLAASAIVMLWVCDLSTAAQVEHRRWPTPVRCESLTLIVHLSARTISVEVHQHEFPPAYFQRMTGTEDAMFRTVNGAGWRAWIVPQDTLMWMNPAPEGFHAQHGRYPQPAGWTSTYSMLSAPLWALSLALAILPGARISLWAFRRWNSAPAAAGRCPSCGYDLRATPDRCPECGSVCTDESKTGKLPEGAIG